MKVVVHDRTDSLSPELKEYARRKLAKLERHFGRVAEAELEYTEERKRFGLSTSVCKIHVHIDGRRAPALSAHERGVDAQSAIDMALDKIDRQVLKLKEKRTHRKQATSPIRVPAPERTEQGRSSEPEHIRMKLVPTSLREAIAELESDGQAFRVFLDEDSGGISVVFRRADGSVAVIEPVVP